MLKKINKRVALVVALLIVVIAIIPFLKQDRVGEGKVVATVNGTKIYDGEIVALLVEQFNLPPSFDYNTIPAEQRGKIIEEVYVSKMVLRDAYKAGLAKDPRIKNELKKLEDNLVKKAFVEKIGKDYATKEKIEGFYNEKRVILEKEFLGKKEVKVEHILLKTKTEADRLYYRISSKKVSFAEGVKSSIDKQSVANGGYIGYFVEGNAPAELKALEKKAFATKVGSISRPVQTKLGWHILKIDEKRDAKVPSLSEIYPQVKQELYIKAVQDYVEKLKASVKVELVDAPSSNEQAPELKIENK